MEREARLHLLLHRHGRRNRQRLEVPLCLLQVCIQFISLYSAEKNSGSSSIRTAPGPNYIRDHGFRRCTPGSWNGCQSKMASRRAPLLCKESVRKRVQLFPDRNGGGAFFVPYVLMVIVLAAPLTFMEFCLGQFCSLDCIKCRNYSPVFKGDSSHALTAQKQVGQHAVLEQDCCPHTITVTQMLTPFSRIVLTRATDVSCRNWDFAGDQSVHRVRHLHANHRLRCLLPRSLLLTTAALEHLQRILEYRR